MAAYQRLMQSAADRLVPISTLIELTYHCNLACRHCYLKPTNSGRKEELTLKEWENVFEQLAEMGTLFLTFSGGEPLLHPDPLSVFELARRHRFVLRILTNGTMINKNIACRLGELNPLEIEISLYAAQPEIHDGFTRVPGSFRLALNGTELLLTQGLRVNLKTPILKINQREIEPLRKLARSLGIPIFFYYVLSPLDTGKSTPLQFQLQANEIRPCLKQAADPKTCPPPLPKIPRKPDEPICGAGRNSAAISPLGEVFPCVQIRNSGGNLRSQKFSDIWFESTAFQEARKITLAQIPECLVCPLSGYCSICPGMSLTLYGDIRRPYWPSCQLARARAENAGRQEGKQK